MSSTVALHNGYDEVAAKRVEHQLVELGARFGEARLTAAWLEGALEDVVCSELLERIGTYIASAESDLSRLMCEARKQIRED